MDKMINSFFILSVAADLRYDKTVSRKSVTILAKFCNGYVPRLVKLPGLCKDIFLCL